MGVGSPGWAAGAAGRWLEIDAAAVLFPIAVAGGLKATASTMFGGGLGGRLGLPWAVRCGQRPIGGLGRGFGLAYDRCIHNLFSLRPPPDAR